MLLLGASGKLGRAIRVFGRELPWTLVPVVRRRLAEEEIVWTAGSAFPDIGPVRAIIAMWGDVTGTDPALNARLALDALNLGRELGAQLVVHCSSAAVYGASIAATEQSRISPSTRYGAAKCKMEEAIANWHASNPSGLRSLVLRIGNVAGADSLFRNLRPGGTVTLDRFPSGHGALRSYLSPHDLTQALWHIVDDKDVEGVFNIAGHAPVDMADIVRAAGADILWRTASDGAIGFATMDSSRFSKRFQKVHFHSDASLMFRDAVASGIWP